MSTPAPPPAGSTTETATTPETREEKLKRRQFYLSVVSSLVLIGGGLGSVYQYRVQQKTIAEDQIKQQQKEVDAREQAAQKEAIQREQLAKNEIKQREKEAELRGRELALMIYREKKEAYGLLVDVATDVATAKNRREVEDKTGKFYAVYYGRIHIIPELDQSVQDAKNAFKKKLEAYLAEPSTELPINVFSSPLTDIADACQKGLDCHKLFQKKEPASPPVSPISIPSLFQIPGPAP